MSRDRPASLSDECRHPGGVITELIRHNADDELSAYGMVRVNGELQPPATGYKTVEQSEATSVGRDYLPSLVLLADSLG